MKMCKILLFLTSFFIYLSAYSQHIYKEIHSKRLDETRRIKIQLPRSYEKNTKKYYPVILVLDGDYLFEPVAGNVDYLSYWEDIPEAIVVGIVQGKSRVTDTSYDETTFLPINNGANFFEFIGMELMPYLDKEYRTAKFIIAVGHDITANFLNFYLFKEAVLFNGFILFSPDFSPMMQDRIAERIPTLNQKIFYYMATAQNDVLRLKEDTERLNLMLNNLKSDSFHYYYNNFEDAHHYTLVSRGIPVALENIFSVYKPITQKEYNEILLTTEAPLYDFLLNKYAVIKDLYGLEYNIRIQDILAVGTAAERRKKWEELEKLGKLCFKQYPEKTLGNYYIGRYFEETGKFNRAIRTFRDGFGKEAVDFITVESLLDRADALKFEGE
jgi:predicted alpha/beta superfamily hydrolase